MDIDVFGRADDRARGHRIDHVMFICRLAHVEDMAGFTDRFGIIGPIFCLGGIFCVFGLCHLDIEQIRAGMIDTFRTFEDLSVRMAEGKDYRIVTKDLHSPILIVAIHGGNIEPGTASIASSIAGDEYNLYIFEGIRESGNAQLHIGSRYFDEPRSKDMVSNAETIISVHGHRDGENEFVMVGGLAEDLVRRVIDHLQAIDITVRPFETDRDPESPENICNKGMSGGGIEMEVSRKLRDVLQEDEGMRRLFANAVRHAIEAYR